MAFDLTKVAINHGFDDACLMPAMYTREIYNTGLFDLKQIMPDAKSVLLVLKKHNPYKEFPKGHMKLQSHYVAYSKAYSLHKSLIEKLMSIGVMAKSANKIALKSYLEAAGMPRLKNSLMYSREFGTYFVIQAIATDMECESVSVINEDICEDCTLCVRACPTKAIELNGKIDKSKCIRNHVPVKEFIPDNMRKAAGTDFIGCGICQSVCPLNKHIEKVEVPDEVYNALNIESILEISSNKKQINSLQTLIGKNEARPGRTIATACMMAGNSKEYRYLPALSEILTNYINPLARGYAAWAIGEIGGATDILKASLLSEHNPEVRDEIVSALSDK